MVFLRKWFNKPKGYLPIKTVIYDDTYQRPPLDVLRNGISHLVKIYEQTEDNDDKNTIKSRIMQYIILAKKHYGDAYKPHKIAGNFFSFVHEVVDFKEANKFDF